VDLKPQEARDLVGQPLHDSRGDLLGEISGVYFDDAGGQLGWLSVAVPASDPPDEQDSKGTMSPDIANLTETPDGPVSEAADMSDSRRTSDSEGDSGLQQRFVPAGALTKASGDRLALSFDADVLANQPYMEARDGALSNAQVARLHEFFHTFDGHSRITTASESGPTAATATTSESVPFTGRTHEPAFGTGAPSPGEPHDVTLQGTGNPSP